MRMLEVRVWARDCCLNSSSFFFLVSPPEDMWEKPVPRYMVQGQRFQSPLGPMIPLGRGRGQWHPHDHHERFDRRDRFDGPGELWPE